MNNILENRKFDTIAPKLRLYNFQSVMEVKYTDWTSSAGDWSGYIVQQIGNVSYMIPFSQTNNHPRSGFTVHTGKRTFTWTGEIDREVIELMGICDRGIKLDKSKKVFGICRRKRSYGMCWCVHVYFEYDKKSGLPQVVRSLGEVGDTKHKENFQTAKKLVMALARITSGGYSTKDGYNTKDVK